MIWLLLISLDALAAFGTVDVVTIRDASGNWSKVDSTADAVRVRDGKEEPLTEDMTVDVGDVIRTTQARVKLTLADKELMSIGEGSEVTLKERGVLQTLGDVYYQLRGAFSVEYGHVEATVEGTRFLIEQGDIQLAVAEGAVRVKDESGGEALVGTREITSSAAEPKTWLRSEMGPRLQQTWPLGRPVVMAVGSFSVGYGQRGLNDRFRFSGRLSPLPHLWLDVSVGYASRLLRWHRFPLSVGVDYQIADFAVGVDVVAMLYHSLENNGYGPLLTGRYTLPIDRHLYIEGQGRVGWIQNDIWIEFGAGVGLGF